MKRRLNGYWSTFLGPGLVYLECKFYLVNTIYVELKYIGKQAFLRIRFFHNKQITDVFAVVPLEKLDDLSSKYGIANENAVSAKKRNKKIKSRPLDIEFPLHGNGLTRCVFFFLTFWLFVNFDQISVLLLSLEIARILENIIKGGAFLLFFFFASNDLHTELFILIVIIWFFVL